MTDSVRIPDLHLFGSRKRVHAATRDSYYNNIQHKDYSIRRPSSSAVSQLQLSKFNFNPIGIPIAEPIPVPVPVPVPVPAYDIPARPPILPYQPNAPLLLDFPHFCSTEYIPAPTTYLNYAEQYLMGRPIPILPPIQTARFHHVSRGIQSSRRNIINQSKQISKNIYASNIKKQTKIVHHHHNHSNSNKKQIIQPQVQPVPQINIKPPQKIQPAPQLQNLHPPPGSPITRDPYVMMSTQRNIVKQIIKNGQIQSHVIHNHINPSPPPQPQPPKSPPPPKKVRDQITQTQKQGSPQGSRQPSPNKHSRTVIEQKLYKNTFSNDKSFRQYIGSKFKQINDIRLNLSETDGRPIGIYTDIEELSEAKQNYMIGSRNILLKLEELAGDANSLSLVWKLLERNKEGFIWPDI